MRPKIYLLSTRVLTAALVALSPVTATAAVVDLELLLLSDTSFSVDASEFALVRQACSTAFRSNSVKSAIAAGPIGAIAVQMTYWGESQQDAVGWRMVTSDTTTRNPFRTSASCNDVADANIITADQFANLIDSFNGGNKPGVGADTHLENAIQYGQNEFGVTAGNVYTAARQIIDIGGDGPDNEGQSTSASARDARAQAVAAASLAAYNSGIDQINAIAILGDSYFTQYGPTSPSGITSMRARLRDVRAARDRLVHHVLRRPHELPDPA